MPCSGRKTMRALYPRPTRSLRPLLEDGGLAPAKQLSREPTLGITSVDLRIGPGHTKFSNSRESALSKETVFPLVHRNCGSGAGISPALLERNNAYGPQVQLWLFTVSQSLGTQHFPEAVNGTARSGASSPEHSERYAVACDREGRTATP